MRIKGNKELTAVAPDSVDSSGGGVRGDREGAADDGEHRAGLGCGRWQRDLERGGKSPAAAVQELGCGRGTS
jgi:hypothetical protein